jgi:peptidoglycan LD-endopeptidase CwlK
MPSFSPKSAAILSECDHALQEICERVIKVYDFTILEGHRSNERQDELFRQGKSKLKAGQSKHNAYPSRAVDIAPYPVDWSDTKRFFLLAGFMFQAAHEVGVQIRWGGDWDGDWEHKDQTFHDLPHFEVKTP